MTRPLTLAQAQQQYRHRFTMEHIPDWATRQVEGHCRSTDTQRFYAPQYRSDAEWFANTQFPGETQEGWPRDCCYSGGETWPLGQWMDRPYRRIGRRQ